MGKAVTPRTSKRTQLIREDWLAKAFDVLAQNGGTILSVEALAKALGVTKGSFYWHFKDRNEFVRDLLDYWFQAFTMNVVEKIDATPGTPEERLLALMQFVTESGASRHDVAVRAWAEREPELDKAVQRADKQRIAYVRGLFSKMGFQGTELDMRTQTFVAYHSSEPSLLSHLEQSEEERQELLKQRHAFFIRK